jgi:hypothetical protein
MAYSRRPVIAYARGITGGTNAATRPRANGNLSVYRNKIGLVLLATVAYTAFLYRSGSYLMNAGGLPSQCLS